MTIMPAHSNRPRALVAHSFWGRGGAEAAAMWTMSALARDFDLTVHTRGGFDLAALNDLAGTALAPAQVAVHIDRFANRWSLGALAHGTYLRGLSKIGADYDLRVTASGVMRWGIPAVHFISSVTWNEALAARFNEKMSSRQQNVRRRFSSGMVSAVSGTSRRSIAQDLFIANSHWTLEQSRQFCPGRMEVIYPAVSIPSEGSPWEDRDDAVLVLGRLSPEKRIDSCIRIVERARSLGFTGRLVIAGPHGEACYSAYVASLCSERKEWIELLPLQSSTAKARLLGQCRYGLNACRVEAFGIATAEMLAGGALVLVPAGCGQSEIVPDCELTYQTEEEAAQRLIALQATPALRTKISANSSAVRDAFTPAKYMDAVQSLALEFVSSQRGKGES